MSIANDGNRSRNLAVKVVRLTRKFVTRILCLTTALYAFVGNKLRSRWCSSELASLGWVGLGWIWTPSSKRFGVDHVIKLVTLNWRNSGVKVVRFRYRFVTRRKLPHFVFIENKLRSGWCSLKLAVLMVQKLGFDDIYRCLKIIPKWLSFVWDSMMDFIKEFADCSENCWEQKKEQKRGEFLKENLLGEYYSTKMLDHATWFLSLREPLRLEQL